MRPVDARREHLVGLCRVGSIRVLRPQPAHWRPCGDPIDDTPVNSWVGSALDGEVLLVQFTRAGQTLQGTLDVSYFSDTVTVSSTHAGFSGVIDGTNITLNFPLGLGVTTTVSGSIDSATLALFPNPTTGSLVTIMLRPGGLDKYNAGARRCGPRPRTTAEG